jgi:hypothetical protein
MKTINEIHTPSLARKILNRCLPAADREFLLGDFDHIFKSIESEKGLKSARLWYWRQCIKTIPVFLWHRFTWRWIMNANYLKVASRNIRK